MNDQRTLFFPWSLVIGAWSFLLIAVSALSQPALADEPSETQLELLTTFKKEFVPIRPGEGYFRDHFVMGSDDGPMTQQPARHVEFEHQHFFKIAKYEVPQNLWEAVMGSNPSRWKGPRNSVEMINFDEANEFCAKATKLMRAAKLIHETEVVRLPSEAEWEYVARGNVDTIWSFGDDVTMLDEYAWHTGNAAGNDPPVGAKKPTKWGVYDIYGYLNEWTADSWQDGYTDAPKSAKVWPGGDAKRAVVRGGSWKEKPEVCNSRHRFAFDKSTRDDAVGFRCVLAKE
jgi:formylglycine-generating enzyme required for sulfatase activity